MGSSDVANTVFSAFDGLADAAKPLNDNTNHSPTACENGMYEWGHIGENVKCVGIIYIICLYWLIQCGLNDIVPSTIEKMYSIYFHSFCHLKWPQRTHPSLIHMVFVSVFPLTPLLIFGNFDMQTLVFPVFLNRNKSALIRIDTHC